MTAMRCAAGQARVGCDDAPGAGVLPRGQRAPQLCHHDGDLQVRWAASDASEVKQSRAALVCARPHASSGSPMRKPADLPAPAVCTALRIPRAGQAGGRMQGEGGNAAVQKVLCAGYTRIPVYEKHPQDIIGILYTKDLILVDPGDSQAALMASLSEPWPVRWPGPWIFTALCCQNTEARVQCSILTRSSSDACSLTDPCL